MPTVAQLYDRIFRLTENKFTDKFYMLDLMNDAQNGLADQAKLKSKTDISVLSGTSQYALPDTFKAPIAMIEGELASPDNVYPLLDIASSKFGYAIYDGFIYFKPEPNENKTVTFYYYKYPTQLSASTDTPEIDSEWHHLLSLYAAALLTGDKKLLEQWQIGQNQFSSSMMRKNKNSRVREKVVW